MVNLQKRRRVGHDGKYFTAQNSKRKNYTATYARRHSLKIIDSLRQRLAASRQYSGNYNSKKFDHLPSSSIGRLYAGGYHEKIPDSYARPPSIKERLPRRTNNDAPDIDYDPLNETEDMNDESKKFIAAAKKLQEEKQKIEKKVKKAGHPSDKEVFTMLSAAVVMHEHRVKNDNATLNPLMYTKIKDT